MPSILADRKANMSNMFGLLSHWELVERMPGERDDGSVRTGWYRITPRGRQFVRGEIGINKYVYTYNSERLKRLNPDTTQIGIREALKEKFDYNELMSATPDGSSGETGI